MHLRIPRSTAAYMGQPVLHGPRPSTRMVNQERTANDRWWLYSSLTLRLGENLSGYGRQVGYSCSSGSVIWFPVFRRNVCCNPLSSKVRSKVAPAS